MNNNAKMKYYLSKNVFPLLIEKGFTGKYPHFRKVNENSIHLISFQTNKWGGSFTVEVSAVFPKLKNRNFSSQDMNSVEWNSLTEDVLNVWYTNERYRLKGMYDGWFYYRDLYAKRVLGFGKCYLDVSEKQVADFVPSKGYKLVQKFNNQTAAYICNEVNNQLIDAFRWLEKFEKKNK